ncbi:MAG: NAD(P)H-dependent oxidoreductase subunit E [Dehalococcoidia bacterium]|nr:MAG: NAD(P)H-dependent oxidoreductase subunit E [Dehalococcoidia bacterium]
MPRLSTREDLELMEKRILHDMKKINKTLIVCGGTGCRASRSQGVIEALNKELLEHKMDSKIHLRVTGCHGFCEQGPIVVIEPDNTFYCHVKPEDAHDIVIKTLLNDEIINKILYTDPVSGEKICKEEEIPFYHMQDRQLLYQNHKVNPLSIEDYISIGGFSALSRVINNMSPEEIIHEIKVSGLRGRGGGGFPTGRKWKECREAPSDEKYIICNADEGDPGAYMDRCLLEGNPYLVLEGMMIGAYATGAQKGYIYVRNEYPLAVKHARHAVQRARKLGLLGENVFGSSFTFDVDVARGGGAFVCGESTALMASLEGKVGEPRPKDVHTVIDGLWHKPTTLNNVETWANIPSIILKGAKWFASKGTKGSKGTKIIALTGRIKNTGLVEVAMGTTINSVVFGIGGGAIDGKSIKAVQTGGPSGGCLPVDKFNLPIDFDVLYEAGSMIGSGGVVVMDESSCMVDVAKYFLEFLQDESCGMCTPCNLGIDRMLEIVTDITEGHGTPAQLNLLEELADTVNQTSLCGLGKTAANPVLSTLNYFRKEYEEHINNKKCPACVCKTLIEYFIDSEKCTGCSACMHVCIHEAISGNKKEVHIIDPVLCQKCGICKSECKFEAIRVK